MKFLEHNYFFPESRILKWIARLKYFNRIPMVARRKSDLINDSIDKLKSNGYVVLENYIEENVLNHIRENFKKKLEIENDFEFPCLAQTKIDEIKHKDLIDLRFRASNEEFRERGITFEKEDVSSYSQMINEFKPSTLKSYLPNDFAFYNLWLDEDILSIVEGYLGMKPYLLEAYIRRNFKANHKVMNHYWHRDTNNKFLMLKAFIFLNDCTIENGPHEYVERSIFDRKLNGKNYYTDEEVGDIYPEGHERRIKSIVKAGTVVLEDTRGLHRACIPKTGHRDLGYAIFVPLNIFSNIRNPYYKINQETFRRLSPIQRKYIPSGFVIQNN